MKQIFGHMAEYKIPIKSTIKTPQEIYIVTTPTKHVNSINLNLNQKSKIKTKQESVADSE